MDSSQYVFSLNARKSNFVIFHRYQKRLDHEVILNIFDYDSDELVSLDQKTYIKYLCVFLDSNLKSKSICLIFFALYRYPLCPSFFLPTASQSPCMLYFRSISTLMHNIFNYLSPCNISNLSYSASEIHTYNTRYSSELCAWVTSTQNIPGYSIKSVLFLDVAR